MLTLDNCNFLLCNNSKLTLRDTIAVKAESLRFDFVLRKEVFQVFSEHVCEISDLLASHQKLVEAALMETTHYLHGTLLNVVLFGILHSGFVV